MSAGRPGGGPETDGAAGGRARPAAEADPPEARLRTGFLMHPAAVLHDTGWGHPEHQGRLRALASALRADVEALHDKVEQAAPEVDSEAALEAVVRVHSRALVDAVRRASAEAGRRGAVGSLDADTKVSGASWEAALGTVGAGLEAVRAVAGGGGDARNGSAAAGGSAQSAARRGRRRFRNAFVASRPPGHHATPDRAMGFCLFNNVAVAAAALRAEGLAERVLIVDWDVHHGNGTQDAFYDDGEVLFLSLHQFPHYPGTGAASETGRGRGEGFTINVPLAPATPRDDYLKTFERALGAATERLAPDFVLVSAGFDVLAGDPLGGQLLEPRDLHRMTRAVVRAADAFCSGRVAVFLEGGYDPARTGAGVVAVIRALAGVAMDGRGCRQ